MKSLSEKTVDVPNESKAGVVKAEKWRQVQADAVRASVPQSYISRQRIARRFIWQQLEQAVENTKSEPFLYLRGSEPAV